MALTGYGSVETHDAFWLERGNPQDWSDSSAPQKQLAISDASDYFDLVVRYPGWRSTQDQSRPWPREGVYDPDGYPVEGVPSALVQAVSLVALEIRKGVNPLPNTAAGQAQLIKSKSEGLDVFRESVTYEGGFNPNSNPVFQKAMALLYANGLVAADDGTEILRG